ncbi:pseudouridine synthase [Aspergillus japonicus CBS 114.51]|uniref:tRNA pseudouridine(55) synthase n=2 Tax=Aspergillus TaxID=5052 RepID=A0A2V5H418_ASPV1|nr:pseudouridine synthase [Aspergillus japonicus CBS 114.51]PYI15593.1 pseudouridine synthase [Aspergillus violaceofuscus CBS 115571]RAH78536.1 pseudouridine synthase [Aspergillus japonicus CBS 114.51]
MGLPRSFKLFRTTMSGEKIYEGVFAVHKPQGVSSADVIRTLQKHFNPSQLFRPWLASERARRDRESQHQRRRRRTQRLDVKIGHGGTLDPLATGVLVAGVGKGTKYLNNFLGCTKTYETVVLFGAETDTYDVLGKVVRRAPYEHVTRAAVERALDQFRGEIMQRPPIFSALRVQGKRLYEYAREGLEPPVEIKARPVEVTDLRVVEWYEPGTHEYKWPVEEAVGEEREVAERMLRKEDALPVAEAAGEDTEAEGSASGKRKAEASPPPPLVAAAVEESSKVEEGSGPAAAAEESVDAPAAKKVKVSEDGESVPAQSAEAAPAAESASAPETTEKKEEAPVRPQPAAVKITMTVSSGFYVRSLAHDLGKAVGSCGLMSSLVRSRQADFVLEPEKVLEYKDLEAGEEVWGPKVQQFLQEWEDKRAAENEAEGN